MNPILSRYGGNLPFSIQERDIDLLLVEQLHVSTGFSAKIAERLGLAGATVDAVRHSVYREHGETDVLVIVNHQDRRLALMIEDKIGAQMQPDQCERYHLRGKALCDEGAVDSYLVILCAPAGYLAGVADSERWDYRVSLEDVADIVRKTAFPGWEWREAVLFAAASRQTRAREADNRSNRAFDAIIAPLKHSYRAFVQRRYPQLKASKQEGRDREYYLGATGLPSGIFFKHAFFRGEVSLIFQRAWAATAKHVVDGNLPESAWAVQHGSEFHVRLPVEVMDPQLPFEQQEELVAVALDKVVLLKDFANTVVHSPS